MIYNPRLIARLDIKGNNVIKGLRFEGVRVIGSAKEFAKKYYDQGIDEIIYLDSVASLYGRNSLTELIDFSTDNIFVPVTVGGGIKSLEDAQKVLAAGADKIAINTAAIENKKLIKEISEKIGSQSLTISIQAKKKNNNKWEAFKICGRESAGIDVATWVKEIETLGAGEILVTSVDQDGTELGLDKDLINLVTESTNLPVIGSGGCKDVDDILSAFQETDVSGIAIGSILHYEKIDIKNIKKELKKIIKKKL
jgi:imidazoleglycerol phosphate synthase cyclase subunit